MEVLLELIKAFVHNEAARNRFGARFKAKAWLQGNEYLKKILSVVNFDEISVDTPVFGMGLARGDADTVVRLSSLHNVEGLLGRVFEIADKGIECIVLIDDPDQLFGDTSHFVAMVGGLLHAAVDLTSRADDRRVKVCVFLKQHKFDYLARKFEDFDHIRSNALPLAWTDDELKKVIAERIKFRERLKKNTGIVDAWGHAFEITDSKGLAALTDFIFPRLTNGPRDLIEFCNRANQAATEDERDKITLNDLTDTEPMYSNDCLDEVEREYGDIYPEIADVIKKLFEHSRLRKSEDIKRRELEESLSEAYRSEDVQLMKRDVAWLKNETGIGLVHVLFKVGVIGFVSRGRSKVRVMSYSPRTIADSVANAQLFFVHPAYASALGFGVDRP